MQIVRPHDKAADITTEVCNHAFRCTAITAILENRGTLEKARRRPMDPPITQLYDRRRSFPRGLRPSCTCGARIFLP